MTLFSSSSTTSTAVEVCDGSGVKKGPRQPTTPMVLPDTPPPQAIKAGVPQQQQEERAVHMVRLSALEHNFRVVESAANRQRCDVITVVKADGCEYLFYYL